MALDGECLTLCWLQLHKGGLDGNLRELRWLDVFLGVFGFEDEQILGNLNVGRIESDSNVRS